jgi:hypothetical protein
MDKHGLLARLAALPRTLPHRARATLSVFSLALDAVLEAWLRPIPSCHLVTPLLPVVHRSQMWAINAVSYIPWLVGQRGGSSLAGCSIHWIAPPPGQP